MARWLIAVLLVIGPSVNARWSAAAEVGSLAGQRIVLVGSTLIERDAAEGYLETLITKQPGEAPTFRNLGWSGDTVFGDARAGFENAAKGFERLKELVIAEHPTVLIVGYGTNEAFAGPEGLPAFTRGLNTLLDTLSATKARVILLSPARLENLGSPLPDPAQQNANLKLYSEAIDQIASERDYQFVDLFSRLGAKSKTDLDVPLTDNGQHLTPYGYWRLARTVVQELGPPADSWEIAIPFDAKKAKAVGAEVSDLQQSSGNLAFTVLDGQLPTPVAPVHREASRVIRFQKLPAGQYALKIDGTPVATAPAADWAAGVRLDQGPEFDQVEKLREAINLKNELYFHRWRPQNETYLLGFRKHEQGRNAKEIVEFDPLVAEQEQAIAKLRLPVKHRYELVRISGKSASK